MIDTYSSFSTLKEAGIEDRQAGAMTKAIAGLVCDSLATKADVAELRNEVDRRFNGIDSRLAALDAKLGAGLQRNFIGFLSVLGGFVALATYVGVHVK
jgi:hypothetical protein